MNETTDESPRSSAPPSEPELPVKNGKFVYTIGFTRIKLITILVSIFLLVDIFLCFKMFASSIRIRGHIGYFINMIATGEGNVLPSLQAIPVLFYFVLNVLMMFLVYKAFDETAKPHINRIMFILILISLIFFCIILAVIIAIIAHAYGAHESLHDGIVKAMNNYSTSIKYKRQIDMLQIELQCCGSKKYDEWYTIKWFDENLERGESDGGGSLSDGNTPFSCCSMHSMFPCIHHNIEATGKAYLYTPEFNLSISTRGCYEMIRERKQQVGWHIVLSLVLFLSFQFATMCCLRFLQTGHCHHSKFVGHSDTYTIWLLGSHNAETKAKEQNTRTPPSPPPIPHELKDQ